MKDKDWIPASAESTPRMGIKCSGACHYQLTLKARVVYTIQNGQCYTIACNRRMIPMRMV